MITKLASAALVALAVTGILADRAAAGDTSSRAVEAVTLRFAAGTDASAEGRAAIASSIRRAARASCTASGSRIRNGACERAFIVGAIDSISRPALQALLRQDMLGPAGPAVAATEPLR